MPRPAAEVEGSRTPNIMKRIISIPFFILLAGSILASCGQAQTAPPTRQPGQLSLDMQPECLSLQQGLCVVSEPGESLGAGQTTVISDKPEAAFLEQTTALQIKVQDWTLVFDPGGNTPFSVGMTFPNAKLYPQGKNPGMLVEHGDKKCTDVEGSFTDDTLQSAQSGSLQVNPISWFDIRFTMRCNGEPRVILGRVKLSQ